MPGARLLGTGPVILVLLAAGLLLPALAQESSAEQVVRVPQLHGWLARSDIELLRKRGLNPSLQPVSTATRSDNNRVISVEPAEGSWVSVGTQVTVRYHVHTVIVPNLMGRTLRKAKRVLDSLDLRFRVSGPEGDSALVHEQNPAPGGSVPVKSAVQLSNPAEVQLKTRLGSPVPDVVGLAYDSARARLMEMGYRVERVVRRGGSNTVVGTVPTAGTEVAPGGLVELTVNAPAGGAVSPLPLVLISILAVGAVVASVTFAAVSTRRGRVLQERMQLLGQAVLPLVALVEQFERRQDELTRRQRELEERSSGLADELAELRESARNGGSAGMTAGPAADSSDEQEDAADHDAGGAVSDILARDYNAALEAKDRGEFRDSYQPVVAEASSRDRAVHLVPMNRGNLLVVRQGTGVFAFPQFDVNKYHLPVLRLCFEVEVGQVAEGAARRYLVAIRKPARCKSVGNIWKLEERGVAVISG